MERKALNAQAAREADPGRQFEWVEGLELFGEVGDVCVWEMDYQTLQECIRLSETRMHGGVDAARHAILQIVACARDGEPPDGKPIFCEITDTGSVKYWQERLPVSVVRVLIAAVNRVSGFDRDREAFTEAQTEPSSES